MTTRVMDQLETPRPAVLVIDSSPDIQRLLRGRLSDEDLIIECARTGRAGQRLASELRPAIIILDLEVPEGDGFNLLRALKEDAETMDIPVIVLSGVRSADAKVKAFNLGAVDYITKPFNMIELSVRVHSALRTQRMLRLLEQRVQVDGMTGLWNRTHFDSRWAGEVARANRHNRALSLAMIDADHFKNVNDLYGHPAGDAVLRGMARMLRTECRGDDIACRYGGEEFVLILPDTGPRDALTMCERVRARARDMRWARHPNEPVTVSIGVVGSTGTTPARPEQWVEQADRNLYRAKQSGRDCVIASELSLEPPLAQSA